MEKMFKNKYLIGRVKSIRESQTQKIKTMTLRSIIMNKNIVKMREISTFWF